MATVVTANLGNSGRLVIPQSLCQRHGWSEGTVLVFTENDGVVQVTSAEEALTQFRGSVAGKASPVDELITERRRAAEAGE